MHSLNIEQCSVSNNGRIFWQNSSGNNRTTLEQVVFTQPSGSTGSTGTHPLLCFTSGVATLSMLHVTGKDNAPLLQFEETGTLESCAFCKFESGTAEAAAQPIIKIKAGNSRAYPLDTVPLATPTPSRKVTLLILILAYHAKLYPDHPALTVAYNTFNLSGCNSSCYNAIKYTLYTVA